MTRSITVGRRAVALLALLPAMAGAQEARVRAALADAGDVWVGQRATLVVELLAPGYFASAAQFDIPDPAGVLLMPPQEHPLVGNETIDGTLYTVQRHELPAWPMRAGARFIPAVTVHFSYKRHPLDTDERQATVTTEPVALTVNLPPGAEHLGTVISARDLEVRESWQPEPGGGAIEAGTAFTRTVTFTAPDVPGMVFPPFPAGDIEGLGIYAKPTAKPSLADRASRGELTGQRRDVLTYVAERPGRYTIPAAQLTWFDLDAQALRTETLPAVILNVVAGPAFASAAGAPAAPVADADARMRRTGTVGLALLVSLVLQTAFVRRRLANAIAAVRPVYLEPLNPGVAGGGR